MYYPKVTYKQVALKRRLCVGHRRGVITWGVPHGGHRTIVSQVFIRHWGRKSKYITCNVDNGAPPFLTIN